MPYYTLSGQTINHHLVTGTCILYLYLYLSVLVVPVLGNEVSFDTEASIGADSGVPIEDCAELVPPETRDENSSLKECEKEVI